MRRHVVFVLVAAALGVSPRVSNAAFPGSNGKVAFVRDRDGNRDIFVMNPDGSGQTNVSNDPSEDGSPAWSPDGKKIAFHSNRTGNFDVYVMNADGSRVTDLTNNDADDGYPQWSPDGSRLIFTSNRDGNVEIYVMNADGSGITRLTHDPASDLNPRWSPDGARIAFSSDRANDGYRHVYVMNVDGSNVTQLTYDMQDADNPDWAPDGAKLVFSSGAANAKDVYVMNADGTGIVPLSNDPADDTTPGWAPDGAAIVFSSNRGGTYGICETNTDGTVVTCLTNDGDTDPDWGRPATPAITWANPAAIIYGTVLGGVQLNAITDVPGIFLYTPAAGTILNAGNTQTLSATFVPADTFGYNTVVTMVQINVMRATPILKWPKPGPITYGTPLGVTELKATTNTPGKFTYSPSFGAILPLGNGQLLSVDFTPDDLANFTTATAHVTIDVRSVASPAQPPFAIVHAFAYQDGANPYSGLIEGRDGFFYGTTYSGYGNGSYYGYGTVYRMDAAGVVTTLHTFDYYNDGGYLYAGLAEGSDGFFYGTTSSGGANGSGTVYRIDAKGNFEVLHSFTSSEGGNPSTGVVQGGDGAFYGTTASGGSNSGGAVYRIDTAGNFSTHHAFDYYDGNGAVPYGGLIKGSNGALYGTTVYGGQNGVGTIFGVGTIYRIDISGNFTMLHAFSYSNDGAYPYGGLVEGSDGFFYGTTSSGGSDGNGTAYRMDANGNLSVLHGFLYSEGVPFFAALIQGQDGALYGTTYSGGANGYGTVYRLDADGNVTLLHMFTSTEGSPRAGLVQGNNGSLYGTTYYGGAYYQYGTVFRLMLLRGTRSASRLVVSAADSVYGAGATAVWATLTSPNTGAAVAGRQVSFKLFGLPVGTATTGSNGTATLDAVNLAGVNAGVYSGVVEASFDGDTTYLSSRSKGNLTVDKQAPYITWYWPAAIVHPTALGPTQLNATTSVKGTLTYAPTPGTILPVGQSQTLSVAFAPEDVQNFDSATYEVRIDVTSGALSTPKTTFQVLHGFTWDDGAYPSAAPIPATDGALYGTTYYGGPNTAGTVYKTDLSSGTTSTVYAFTGGADGGHPAGGLVQGANGAFYGTTYDGGANDFGTVFRVDAFGNLTTLVDFTWDNGAHPSAGLSPGSDGFLYGTAFDGGESGFGTAFRIDVAGKLTILVHFTGDNGAFPSASLTRANDGLFYGTTSQGGTNNYGVIYTLTADGKLTTLHSFNWISGAYPYAPVIQGSDGLLYGTTAYGGWTGEGTVYQLNASRIVTTLYNFEWDHGAYPYSPLVPGNDGFFYGTTFDGGPNGNGTVFQADASGQLATVLAFDGINGAHPYAGVLEASDGFLYGTTQQGGAHSAGTVVRLTRRGVTRLVVSPAVGLYGGAATLSATLTYEDPLAVPGREVSFTINGSLIGKATTGDDGVATFMDARLAGFAAGTYPGAVVATFATDDSFTAAIGKADLIVSKRTPNVTVTMPAATVYDGNGHEAAALATGVNGESVAGSFAFTYTPGGAAPPVNAGAYTVTAAFTSGDPNYVDATGQGTIVIGPAAPTVNALDGTFVYDGAAHGATATATGIGGLPVTGFFAFTYVAGGTAPVDAGTYTATVTFTSVDPNYVGGTATCTITIARAPSTTSLQSSPAPSTLRQLVTFTAVVAAASGNPTGSVTFFDGATSLGTGILTNGQATFSTAALSEGSHDIIGAYSGDLNASPSISAALTQVVGPPPVAEPVNVDSPVSGHLLSTSLDTSNCLNVAWRGFGLTWIEICGEGAASAVGAAGLI